MKKFLFFALSTLLFFPKESFGSVPIAQSGLDLTTSTISLSIKDEANHLIAPNSNVCPWLGDASSPVTLANAGITSVEFDGSIGGSIDGLGLRKCFQKAGTYTLTLTLHDRAGNIAPSSNFIFVIKAANPAQYQTDGTMASQTTASCPQGTLANGVDTCTLTTLFKDRFGNMVTQLSSSSISGVSDLNMASDANCPNGGSCQKFGQNLSFPSTLALSAGQGVISFVSRVASLFKIGDYLAQVVAHTIAWNFTVSDIADNGTLGTGSVSLPFNAPFTFNNLVAIKPNQQGLVTFNPLSCSTTTPSSCTPSSLEFDVTDADSARHSSPAFSVNNLDSQYVTYTGLPSQQSINNTAASVVIQKTQDAYALPSPNPNDGYPLSLQTMVKFTVGGVLNEYSAGGSGLHEQNIWNPDGGTSLNLWTRNGFSDPNDAQFLGKGDSVCQTGEIYGNAIGYNCSAPAGNLTVRAIIEDWGVRGKSVIDTGEKITGQQQTTVNFGETSVKDIGEQISRNAYAALRGAKEYTGNKNFSELINDFTSSDSVVVVHGNVTIDDNWFFPGQSVNTLPNAGGVLIIQDGNLIVNNSFQYDAYNTEHHSFGFVLLSDNTDKNLSNKSETSVALRKKANVYVKPDVQYMAGVYYLDGGIRGVDSTGANIVQTELSNSDNTTQLVLLGTILARENTLGGALVSPYKTPWGSATDKREAEFYDLHFVRRYNSRITGNMPSSLESPHYHRDESFIIHPNGWEPPNVFIIGNR